MIVTIPTANSMPLKRIMTRIGILPLVASRKAMGTMELRSKCIVLAVAAISIRNDQCQVSETQRFNNTSTKRYINVVLGAEQMEYSGQIIQPECQAHTVRASISADDHSVAGGIAAGTQSVLWN